MYHTLWVCASKNAADSRKKTFGDPTDVLFIGACTAITGIRVIEVIIDDMYAEARGSKTLYERISHWFEDDVRCRLVPKGTIRTLTGPLRWKV
jgi:hypothetical protein